jgi:uncharacterized membrane protein YkvI
MKSSSDFSIFKIASAYIGTVVGAGFASGQEVLQFFSAFGWSGLWGIAISSLLFFMIGYSVLLLGRNLKAKSHVDIVQFTNGKVLGFCIDIIITIFLFGALAAMIAGAGAIFHEHFRIPAIWGTLVMALFTLLTVVTGTKGVINAISYVVPFLILSVLFISIYSLLTNPITAGDIQTSAALNGATPNWLLASINYASYNIVIAIAVLAPMGAQTKNKRNLFWGALLGSLGLGLGIFAIYFCVLTNMIDVAAKEVPMIEIASRISVIVKFLFAIVLFAEVYTTAVGNLYGFVRRVSFKLSNLWIIIITTGAALIVSQLGFSTMVKYLYPAVGYGGILFFAGVAYAWIAKRSSLK